MFSVSKQIHFCYGHRLIHYEGRCKHLHGHNAIAEVVLEDSVLDKRGMVWDFADIKKPLAAWIDANLDHRLLLHAQDPLLSTLQKAGEPIFVMDENPTAEAIAELLYLQCRRLQLPVCEVRLWETPDSCATFRGTEAADKGTAK